MNWSHIHSKIGPSLDEKQQNLEKYLQFKMGIVYRNTEYFK